MTRDRRPGSRGRRRVVPCVSVVARCGDHNTSAGDRVVDAALRVVARIGPAQREVDDVSTVVGGPGDALCDSTVVAGPVRVKHTNRKQRDVRCNASQTDRVVGGRGDDARRVRAVPVEIDRVVAEPSPEKSRSLTVSMFTGRSNVAKSKPVSTTATVTFELPRVTSHAVGMWMRIRPHCSLKYSSFGVKSALIGRTGSA